MTATEGFIDVFIPNVLISDARQVFSGPRQALVTKDVARYNLEKKI